MGWSELKTVLIIPCTFAWSCEIIIARRRFVRDFYKASRIIARCAFLRELVLHLNTHMVFPLLFYSIQIV